MVSVEGNPPPRLLNIDAALLRSGLGHNGFDLNIEEGGMGGTEGGELRWENRMSLEVLRS